MCIPEGTNNIGGRIVRYSDGQNFKNPNYTIELLRGVQNIIHMWLDP